MRRTSFVLLLAVVASLFALPGVGRAANINNHVARVPETPTSNEFVRIWIESDTAFGERAGVETLINGVYTKHLGFYDTSGPAPANWRVDLPAQPNGTFVEYQLFTRNQSGNDYGFRGFNLLQRYTVNNGDIQWNGLRHDSFDSYYRSPFGAVPAGTPVTLRFRTFPLDVNGVSVRVYSYDPASNSTAAPVDHALSYLEDRVENGVNYAIWSVTLTTPSSPAIWYYKFRITDRLDVDWFSDVYDGDHDNLGQGGEGAPSDDEGFLAYQLSVYDPNFSTPEWLRNGTVYQIFPDRFRNGDRSNDYDCVEGSITFNCPSFYDGGQPTVPRTTWNSAIFNPRVPGPYENWYGNQYYGGDLKGITQKLDYIQGLGFDTIYLTPIFDGSSNHRYDTDDYLKIDPALGTEADFMELTAEMERRGMYLILDGVFNHTSSDSIYFDRYHRYAEDDGACESLSSEYRAWFEFVNNDIPCGSGDYTGWFGYDSLAVLQDASAAVRDFIYRTDSENVVEHWYVRGADGWRFDVADEISHNWWRDFRPYAKDDNPEGPLVGEVWPDASKFLLGDQLDSVMNYRFRKNVLGFARDQFGWKDNDSNGNNEIVALAPSQFDRALKAVREDYPPQATAAMLNLLDSHDTNRALYALSILGESEAQAQDRLKLAALFQYTYVGAPMVYYGDEAGIDSPSLANGVNGPEDDPYNRAPYPWADEAGDTSVYGPANAGMIDYYTTLGRVRKQFPALRTGAFVTLLTGDTTASGSDNDSYAFARTLAGETSVVVALNQGAGSNSAAIPVSTLFADGTQLNDLLNGGSYTVSGGSVSLTLAARGGAILAPAPASADATAPELSISVLPAPNGAGWNKGPVTVNLTATDTGSGVREIRRWVDDGATVVTAGDVAGLAVSAEGTTSVSGRAFDNAYNSSLLRSVNVKIDTGLPTAGASHVDNGDGSATVTITAADARSGIAAVTYSVNGGSTQTYSGPFTVSGYGSYSVVYSALDLAGNSASDTLSFTLEPPPTVYTFSGFFGPVDNPPVLNTVQAGRGIPVKFSLGGDFGLNIFAVGYPASRPVQCASGAPLDAIEQTVSAGASSLSYDAATGQYTYVWKTDKGWAGSCRQLVIRLSDGQEFTANFKFR